MMPVVEKEGFKVIHIVYIVIIAICVVSIGIAVYKQFFKDEKLGVIFGITQEEEDEELNYLKENFFGIFDNTLNVLQNYDGQVNKIRQDDDVILLAYNIQEQNENYILDIKIPYFNINSDKAKELNKEIKTTFKDKTTSVIADKSNSGIIYNVKYKAYEENNILSLIILSELKEGNSNQRIIISSYNYDLVENREVKIDEIIAKKNIDISQANNKIKSEIKSSQEENIKLQELGYNANVRDANAHMYEIQNVENFFIGEKGYLYVVYAYGNKEYTSEMNVVILK